MKLGRAGPISCAWAGAWCPWASLSSAKMVGLSVLMSASFLSFLSQRCSQCESCLPLLQPVPCLGGGMNPSSTHPHGSVARACPMMLSPGQVPSQLWTGQHRSRHKTQWAQPYCSSSILWASPNPHTLLHPACSLNFIPDVLGHQYETTAEMPLRQWEVGCDGGNIS